MSIRENVLKEAINWWLAYADEQEQAITLGLTCNCDEPYRNRAAQARAVARALGIELKTGYPVCTCCFKPFGKHNMMGRSATTPGGLPSGKLLGV